MNPFTGKTTDEQGKYYAKRRKQILSWSNWGKAQHALKVLNRRYETEILRRAHHTPVIQSKLELNIH